MAQHPLATFRKQQEPRLSQGDLANQLAVARETVARWETGSRKIDERKLSEVSRLTGIPVSELRPDLARLFERNGAE